MLVPETAVYQHLKEREVRDQLMSSQKLKDCRDKAKEKYKEKFLETQNYQEISNCFKNEISSMSPEELKKLDEGLGLKKFGLIDTVESKRITNYFSKLIEDAFLLKIGKGANPNKRANYLDHKEVLRIYQLMVTQQFFAELSEFCLKESINSGGQKLEIQNVLKMDPNQVKTNFEVCNAKIASGCKAGSPSSSNPSYCAFNKRMREYKQIAKQLTESQKDFEQWSKDNPVHTIWGFVAKLSDEAGGDYSTSNAEKKLTKLSSTELVDEMLDEKNQTMSKNAEKFEEKCIKGPSEQDCARIIERGSEETLGEMMMNQELQFLAKQKIISGASDAELKTMIENESSEAYALLTEAERKLLKETNDPKKIREVLMQTLVKSKESIRDNISKRLKQVGMSKDQQILNAQAKLKNIGQELKDRPEELRTIMFFANIISAIPTLKDGDVDTGMANTKHLQTEMDAWKANTQLQSKYGNQAIKWFDDFSSTIKTRAPSSSSGNDFGTVNENTIDGMLTDQSIK